MALLPTLGVIADRFGVDSSHALSARHVSARHPRTFAFSTDHLEGDGTSMAEKEATHKSASMALDDTAMPSAHLSELCRPPCGHAGKESIDIALERPLINVRVQLLHPDWRSAGRRAGLERICAS